MIFKSCIELFDFYLVTKKKYEKQLINIHLAILFNEVQMVKP